MSMGKWNTSVCHFFFYCPINNMSKLFCKRFHWINHINRAPIHLNVAEHSILIYENVEITKATPKKKLHALHFPQLEAYFFLFFFLLLVWTSDRRKQKEEKCKWVKLWFNCTMNEYSKHAHIHQSFVVRHGKKEFC